MIIYLSTNLILYEEEHIIGAYSTLEAAIHAALSGKSRTWHIARVYSVELNTNTKSVIWQGEMQEEKEL